jgi:cytochrome c biogenesis protein
VQIDELEYEFTGRREFAGLSVRKDPGANFIWIATGLLLAGLLLTFYVPRLRLWARVRGKEMVVAAQADRRGAFQSEVKRLRAELGEGMTDA